MHMPSCGPILYHPVDPLNRPGIETEGQQLPGALNFDGQGIRTLFQTLPISLDIGLELLALVAHGSPSVPPRSVVVPDHDMRSHGVVGTVQNGTRRFTSGTPVNVILLPQASPSDGEPEPSTRAVAHVVAHAGICKVSGGLSVWRSGTAQNARALRLVVATVRRSRRSGAAL
jgi:hypothetical protein